MYLSSNFIVSYLGTDKRILFQDSNFTRVGGFSIKHYQKAMTEGKYIWISLVDVKLVLEFQTEADAKAALLILKTVIEELLVTATLSYKSYVASLNFFGEADPDPNYDQIIIFQNNIGDIVWTYNSPGNWTGTLLGAFPQNKVWINFQPTLPSFPLLTMGMNRASNDTIVCYSQAIDLGGVVTQVSQFISYVEIRVYS